MHIVCHAAGCRLGSQGLKEVCVLFREALQLTVCLCFFTSLYIFAAVSLRLKTTLTARWAILLCLKSSVHFTIMKEAVLLDMLFEFPWVVMLPILCAGDRLHFQRTCNLWCAISVLMKRIKYEEFFIQTDAKWNFHTRQPYGQHFPYWFLIKDWISQVKGYIL